MSEPSNSFQLYYTGIEGLNLVTRGLVYEYDTTTVEFITPLGLVTQGLVFGTWDQWSYADNPANAGWVFVS